MVITFNVAFGGMKGITFVQAFQYWAKLFAISVPVFVLGSVFGGYSENLAPIGDVDRPTRSRRGRPRDRGRRSRGPTAYPANVLDVLAPDRSTRSASPTGRRSRRVSTVRKPEPGEDPINGRPIVMSRGPDEPPDGQVADRGRDRLAIPPGGGPIRLEPGTMLEVRPVPVTRRGRPVVEDGRPVVTAAIRIEFQEPDRGRSSTGDGPQRPDRTGPGSARSAR